jgi:uncharacterized protein
MTAQRIAIIGSGISGLTTAHLLARDYNITVFEANDYIGGHTHTVPVQLDGQEYQIDTGFIVCNDRNYPHFLQFMQQLGVALRPTEMSFSVRNNALNLEFNGHNLNTLFSQRRNFLRPSFYRLVGDILKFNKTAKATIEAGQVAAITLDEFVATQHLSKQFRDNYLLPMVAAIWSCSVRQAGEFPLAFFLRFFLNHGLLDIKNRPQWYVLKGGSSAYIEPMTRSFADRIRLNTPVQSVVRHDTHIEVNFAGGSESFDQVVFACHSDQALRLLAQPNQQERSILGAMTYQDNDVILHCDSSIMPRKALSWASWNFLAGENAEGEAGNSPIEQLPLVTYSMNILQGIVSSEPFLVSLNASDKIRPEKIFQQFSYAHPVYSVESMAAQSRRDEICGKDRIHFCGAYWYSGFHEDGVRSALDVCKRFGVTL